MDTQRNQRKNNFGSKVAFSVGTPNTEQRILPLRAKARLVDVSDPSVMSWVICISSKVTRQAFNIMPNMVATVTWGNGGADHSVDVSVFPGTIICVPGNTAYVDAHLEAFGTPGGGALFDITVQATAQRSFADSEPTFIQSVTDGQAGPGGSFGLPVPNFAKAFYVASNGNGATGVYDAAATVTQVAYALTVAQITTGAQLQVIRNTGGAIRIVPGVSFLSLVPGGTPFNNGDFVVYLLDI